MLDVHERPGGIEFCQECGGNATASHAFQFSRTPIQRVEGVDIFSKYDVNAATAALGGW